MMQKQKKVRSKGLILARMSRESNGQLAMDSGLGKIGKKSGSEGGKQRSKETE